MRIDIDYLAKFLNVFMDAETAFITLSDLEKEGIAIGSNTARGYDENLMFHMWLAIDNGLIGGRSGIVSNVGDVGMKTALGGGATRFDAPIRLTQRGHDFANALQSEDILEKLKTGFKNASFKVLFDSSQTLLEHYAKKKFKQLIGE